MLDDVYPRALQWCAIKDIPDNVMNIDIYIYANHTPMYYSIHDTVEKSIANLILHFVVNFISMKQLLTTMGHR